MKHRSPYLLLGIVLAVSVALLTPHFAHAGLMEDTAVKVGVSLFSVVAYIFNTLVGLLFVLAAWLVGVAMSINLTVANSSNTMVGIGWGITRDIANLGFVLAMVVIAFATIVRYEAYGAKKLLVKLVTAAILVNFSLTIGGVLIDFSNVLTGFFLSKINVTPIELATKLAQAFGPQKFLLGDTTDPLPPDPKNQPNVAEAITWGILLNISGLVFSMAFTLISTIVLITFAIMLLVRFVMLTLLLATAPLSWLFSVIPQLQKMNDLWWSKFTQWTFFAPAMTFFVYLALAGLDALAVQSTPETFFSDSMLASIMAVGMRGILLSGTLVGGIMAAKMMGIKGADAGMSAAKGLWTGTKQYVSANAQAIGRRFATAEVGGISAKGVTAAAGVRLQRMGLTGLAGGAQKIRERLEKAQINEAMSPTKVRGPAGLMGSLLKGAAQGTGFSLFQPGEKKEKTREELLAERRRLQELKEKQKAAIEDEARKEYAAKKGKTPAQNPPPRNPPPEIRLEDEA